MTCPFLFVFSFKVTTVDGVIRRYEQALKLFKRLGSMKRAFDRLHVDRNTIARTAIVGELAIVFPEVLKRVQEAQSESEKIADFTERCRKAVTQEMSEVLTAKKKNGGLLPIVHKHT